MQIEDIALQELKYIHVDSTRCDIQIKLIKVLGLPKMLAQVLEGMLSDEKSIRDKAGDYFFRNLALLRNTVLSTTPTKLLQAALIPVWLRHGDIET